MVKMRFYDVDSSQTWRFDSDIVPRKGERVSMPDIDVETKSYGKYNGEYEVVDICTRYIYSPTSHYVQSYPMVYIKKC